MTIIDGKKIARQIREQIKEEVKKMKVRPGIAVVLIGENPASKVYVSMKGIACDDVGFHSEKYELKETISERDLLQLIKKINTNPKIHGILVQLPLPKHISQQNIITAIDPKKDVDGFHPVNVGAMGSKIPHFVPCTALGILHLIKTTTSITGKHTVVVGRSAIVGKPTADLLLDAGATVTVCHSQTKDLAFHTRQADILVVAAGKPKLITVDMVKKGAIIIDVGINRIDGKIVGDVDFENVKKVASAITPVPGGVGPMTIAMLLSNTLESAKRSNHSPHAAQE
jgi:methylenetetrahydrofolate dehydrogenase (NADP+)/methenyltetrahydrofolate cyclohydrolase